MGDQHQTFSPSIATPSSTPKGFGVIHRCQLGVLPFQSSTAASRTTCEPSAPSLAVAAATSLSSSAQRVVQRAPQAPRALHPLTTVPGRPLSTEPRLSLKAAQGLD